MKAQAKLRDTRVRLDISQIMQLIFQQHAGLDGSDDEDLYEAEQQQAPDERGRMTVGEAVGLLKQPFWCSFARLVREMLQAQPGSDYLVGGQRLNCTVGRMLYETCFGGDMERGKFTKQCWDCWDYLYVYCTHVHRHTV